MSSMTLGAGGQTFADASRTRPANCAHLHSALGPGCPYCREDLRRAALTRKAGDPAGGRPRVPGARKPEL
jgi:hypothetical protein